MSPVGIKCPRPGEVKWWFLPFSDSPETAPASLTGLLSCLPEGVQLLCLIDKAADACRYLQTYGEWNRAAWLAKVGDSSRCLELRARKFSLEFLTHDLEVFLGAARRLYKYFLAAFIFFFAYKLHFFLLQSGGCIGSS